MSVLKSQQRALDIQETEKVITTIEREILDNEDLETLGEDARWQKLCKAYREAMEKRVAVLEDLKRELFTIAMPPARSVELREQVMLMERDRLNMEDFLGLPARTKDALKIMREDLESHKKRLRELRGKADHA